MAHSKGSFRSVNVIGLRALSLSPDRSSREQSNCQPEPNDRDGPSALFGIDDSLIAITEGSSLTVWRFDELGSDQAMPLAHATLESPPTRLYAGGRRAPLRLFALDAGGRLAQIDFADTWQQLAASPTVRPLVKALDTPILGVVVMRRQLVLQTGEPGEQFLYTLDRRSERLTPLGRLALDTDLTALDGDRHNLLLGRDGGEARLVLFGADTAGPEPEVHELPVPRVTAALMADATHLVVAQKGGLLRKLDLRSLPLAAAPNVDPWARLCYLLRVVLKRCGCDCDCRGTGSSDDDDTGGSNEVPGDDVPGNDEPCADRHRAKLNFTVHRLHRVGSHLLALSRNNKHLAILDSRLNVLEQRHLNRHGAAVLAGQRHSQNLLIHLPRQARLEALSVSDYIDGLKPALPDDFGFLPLPKPQNVTYWGQQEPVAAPNPTINVCVFPVIEPGQTYGEPTMDRLIDQIDAKAFDRVNDYYAECSFDEADFQFTTFGFDIGGVRRPLVLPRALLSYWYEPYRGGGLSAVMPADWANPIAFDGNESLEIQADPRAGGVKTYTLPFAAMWTSRDLGDFPVNISFDGSESAELAVETQTGDSQTLALAFGPLSLTLNQGDDPTTFLDALAAHVTAAIRNAEAGLPGSPVLIQDVRYRRIRLSNDDTEFGRLEGQFQIEPAAPASVTQKGRLSVLTSSPAGADFDIGLTVSGDIPGVMDSASRASSYFRSVLRAAQIDAGEGIGADNATFNTNVSTAEDAMAQQIEIGIGFTTDFGGNGATMQVLSSSALGGSGWDVAQADPGSNSDPNNTETLRDSIDLADDVFTAACEHIRSAGSWNRASIAAMFANFDVMMITHIGAPHPAIPSADAWACDEPADFATLRMYKRTHFATDLNPPAGETPVQMGTDAITGQKFTDLDSADMNNEVGIMAHELGHALTLPDLYFKNGYRDDLMYLDPFAMMAGGNGNFHHFCGWSKWALGWIADDADDNINRTIFVDMPSASGTLVVDAWLVPVEYWDPAMRADVRAEVGGSIAIGQLMKLSLGSDGGVTAFLELRARGTDFSQLLAPQPTVIATNGLDPLSDREWAVNGLYRTSAHLLNSGTELRAAGDRWDFALAAEFPIKGTIAEVVETRMVRGSIPVWHVRVSREQAEFIDLHFQDHAPSWKSPDIWVDWAGDNMDTAVARQYPVGTPTDQGEAVRVPSSGTEKHYAVARVHNAGNAAAEQVRVRWYVCDPPGAGDDGRWVNRGTQSIASVAPGDFETAVFDWNVDPGTNDHQCMRMEIIDWSIPDGIDPATGDTVALASDDVKLQNNIAQQNVFDFVPLSGSPYDPITFQMQVHNDRNRIETAALVPKGLRDGSKLTISPREWRIPPGQARIFNCTLELDNTVIRPGCDNDSGFLLTAWRRGGETDTNWGSCFYHVRPRWRTQIEIRKANWFHGRLSVYGQLQAVTDQTLNLVDDLPLVAHVRLQIDGDSGQVVWKAAQILADGSFTLDTEQDVGKSLTAQAWFDRTERLGPSISNEMRLKQAFVG